MKRLSGIKKVLCVCIGNSDRSPVMAAALMIFLRRIGRSDVACESAGIDPSAKTKKRAGRFAIEVSSAIGLSITDHRSRHISEVGNLKEFDLVICVDDRVAGAMIEAGVDKDLVYNANITNPWPCQFSEDYLPTLQTIMAAMVKVIWRYFTRHSCEELETYHLVE